MHRAAPRPVSCSLPAARCACSRAIPNHVRPAILPRAAPRSNAVTSTIAHRCSERCRDAHAVFSVQLPDSAGADAERRHGFALIKAAREAGVQHFVHTSVCESGRHTSFPRWESGYWWQKYWTDKWDVEEAVRHAGFERWTVLKPAFLMDNFAQPKAKFMFPHLQQGRIVTALRPDTRMQLHRGRRRRRLRPRCDPRAAALRSS